eukprot:TRINITY_DN13691_c0_g1_i1.p1 TRINITY_DN13691_c0_g1~~TRINITY_DN13691_c0_g1_i1.p1  ORF type:complete len:115 (+),score=34.76 TRINITY_DN13691_c0_g1_i1:48-347(+)
MCIRDRVSTQSTGNNQQSEMVVRLVAVAMPLLLSAALGSISCVQQDVSAGVLELGFKGITALDATSLAPCTGLVNVTTISFVGQATSCLLYTSPSPRDS